MGSLNIGRVEGRVLAGGGQLSNGLLLHRAELVYHLISPRDFSHPLLAETYRVWRDGWAETLAEVAGVGQINSDAFTRQDQVGAFFRGGECIGVTCLRWVDRAHPIGQEDSYFHSWPQEAISVLGTRQVCISSNTLIQQRWRGAKLRAGDRVVPLKLVAIGLAAKSFLHSSAELFVGVTRNDRAMQRVGFALGARRVATIQVHGIESDIIVGDRGNPPSFGPVVDHLWHERQHAG